MQRGSVMKSSYKDLGEGDPLTPGYPSKGKYVINYGYRYNNRYRYN